MSAFELYEERKEVYQHELFQLLKIPSISQDKTNGKKAAEWLENKLKESANSVKVIETKYNPVVIAEWKAQKTKGSNTCILFYGHYDVQSPEPLEKWISPPFEPEIREGRIYARGVGDNKGQFFAHICAIESMHKAEKLGVNVKIILDGNEEEGSPALYEAMKSQQNFFKDIDLVVVSDGPADPSWKPTLEFGARGIQTIQIQLRSANDDVHSGNFGGIQPNPVWDVISILKTMRDDTGKCLIEGFYKDVFTPSEAAIQAVEELKRDPETYKKQLGISYFGEELDQPLTHRVIFRPTFNIRGISAGSVKENARTIIPKEVIVEIDVRLVPNQTPEKIEKLFLTHLEKLKKKSDRMKKIIDRCEINFGASFHPMFTPLNLPWTEILEKAIEEGFGEEPLKLPLAGGSLPLHALYKITEKPLYIIPYANPDEANHAPNENLKLEWFEKGVQTSVSLLEKLGK